MRAQKRDANEAVIVEYLEACGYLVERCYTPVLLAEREQFDVHLAQLCAGFNVPLTEARSEAYWRGLERMHLSAFIRVVNHCVGEHGPEKIPTVREVWSHHHVLRRKQRPSGQPETAAVVLDEWTAFANRRLLSWLMQYGPVSEEALARLQAAKQRLTEQFRLIATDDQVTEEEFTAALRNAWSADLVARVAA